MTIITLRKEIIKGSDGRDAVIVLTQVDSDAILKLLSMKNH